MERGGHCTGHCAGGTGRILLAAAVHGQPPGMAEPLELGLKRYQAVTLLTPQHPKTGSAACLGGPGGPQLLSLYPLPGANPKAVWPVPPLPSMPMGKPL